MSKKEIKIVGILFLVLLLVSGGLYGYRYYKMMKERSEIVYINVQHRDDIIAQIDISVDGIYEFTGDYGKLYLEVRDERYHVFDVECPDHTCEGFGWVGKDSIVTISCLPNSIFIFQ
ncbi:MAG: NusG domain II-containing protein [Erysipelotrichales bacterium]|nr:NusG domain II-containing protein [Erysipelotrichales bacterium]